MEKIDLINQLKDKMHEGIVSFKYEKIDGEIREAHGTLKLDIIPEEMHPKNTGRKQSENKTNYYDTDKEEWRSFNNELLISVD